MSTPRELRLDVPAWARWGCTVAGRAPSAFALSALGAAALVGGVLAFAPPGELLHEVVAAAPAFAAVQTFLFCLGATLLGGKLAALRRERAALDAPLHLLLGTGRGAAEGSIDRDGVAAALARIEGVEPALRERAVVRRIEHSLRRLHITGSTGELATILSELSALDEQRFASGHTMIRFLLAVIPVVGFIGTVLGISLAIGGFPAMLQASGGGEGLREPIAQVTGSLGVAFHTTLLALVQAGLLMFLQAYVQRREEDFLTRVDAFGISELLNRVRLESEGVQFKDALERELQDLRAVLAEQSEELLLAFQDALARRGGSEE